MADDFRVFEVAFECTISSYEAPVQLNPWLYTWHKKNKSSKLKNKKHSFNYS